MGSQLRNNHPPPPDVSPAGLQEKQSLWTYEESPEIENGRRERRIYPAWRFVTAFLVCSLVLLGLASVHSPQVWQRLSCHDGRISSHRVEAEMETEAAGIPFESLLDKASPEALRELLHEYLPDRFKEGVWESERQALEAVHRSDGELATSLAQLAKRQTNSSSVSAGESSPPPPPPSSSPEPTPSAPPSSSERPPPPSSSPSPRPPPSPTPTPSPSSSEGPSTPPPSSSPDITPNPPSSEPKPSSSPKPTTSEPSPTTSMGPVPDVDDNDNDAIEDDDEDEDESTLYTTTRSDETTPPPQSPKVIVETSTRTSNGHVVVVESTITVQPSATGQVDDSGRPAASLQNAATRQEQRGLMLAVLMVGAVMGVLLL